MMAFALTRSRRAQELPGVTQYTAQSPAWPRNSDRDLPRQITISGPTPNPDLAPEGQASATIATKGQLAIDEPAAATAQMSADPVRGKSGNAHKRRYSIYSADLKEDFDDVFDSAQPASNGLPLAFCPELQAIPSQEGLTDALLIETLHRELWQRRAKLLVIKVNKTMKTCASAAATEAREVGSQISDLQAQIQDLHASNTSLTVSAEEMSTTHDRLVEKFGQLKKHLGVVEADLRQMEIDNTGLLTKIRTLESTIEAHRSDTGIRTREAEAAAKVKAAELDVKVADGKTKAAEKTAKAAEVKAKAAEVKAKAADTKAKTAQKKIKEGEVKLKEVEKVNRDLKAANQDFLAQAEVDASKKAELMGQLALLRREMRL
ncbi:uncharacterized protein MKK02DRAFT_40761 [Dioszegia hungarica]|uniref:Uncharacterized protein n=1 Tax=Dioszegia hungarica TaxID=4972 RepID=A0AA38LRJ0_9TREE|nr:uncharacterized protein MKK02DRAFT_40761 [Dioszegia hungarica]KAI9632458.1 hypothetical protein MKK02DRAFT_40761 [Dioszegia hungarica]